MAHLEIIPHANDDVAVVHAMENIAMESEGESRPSRIRLPYRDVHKFHNDGLEAGKIPKMLWKMLQEQGYEKQPEYSGTRITYEDSEPVWHVQVYIFTPKPFRGVYEVEKIHAAIASRRSFPAGICDAHVKHTWSFVLTIVSSWMEQSMLISLSEQVGLRTSMSSLYKRKGTSSSRSK
jgi:hypothetical protein